eukprot:gnl/TRDRNA2_/TRDRNA2_183731_c0_seq1.p1 gnl/TRDRNA2_/TRDRNA2_183731_c0~~gnl/TRDRNA2_/TRDRNA2_183731_c0_seq1.p1  ORF type:complete len:244 (+),score=19.59 gnl/TRDRNA2_/TRDRNA2_183731_c0_seq1:61-732(+)
MIPYLFPPADQFLCGFRLTFGVKLTLWYYLCQNVVCCATSVANIVLKMPTLGYATSAIVQIYTAGWCLAGIPLILLALHGTYRRMAMHVRLFLWYMMVSFVIDFAYVVHFFMIKDACDNLPNTVPNSGRAFACGIARSMSGGVVMLVTILHLYAIYIVWSFIQDITAGGSAAVLTDLLKQPQAAFRPLYADSPSTAHDHDFFLAYGYGRPFSHGYPAYPSVRQ